MHPREFKRSRNSSDPGEFELGTKILHTQQVLNSLLHKADDILV